MYGQIHVIVRSLVNEKFGKEIWKKIIDASKCDPTDDFMVFHRYDDATTLALIGAVTTVLGLPAADVLEVFGEHFLTYCLEHGYDKMLRTLGGNLKDFIQNLDSLHELLSRTYKDYDAPSFRCVMEGDGLMLLHYYSIRQGLHHIVVGLLRAVGRELFHDVVTAKMVKEEEESLADGRTQYHVTFRVTWTSGETDDLPNAPGPEVSIRASEASHNWMTPKLFCSLFPYHVVFDEGMCIVQWGVNIARMTGIHLTSGLPMTSVFHLVKPRMALTYDHIQEFINAVYVLQIKVEGRKATNRVTTRKDGLVIKGEMVRMSGTHQMIFICSPRLSDLNELLERNVYLSDIPRYDVTRELVLLNQQRIAEIEVSKKLDETTAELTRTGQALEVEKAKTDMLLHQMLPVKVADALREGHTVEAEKFEEVTILFSDIVTFTNIAAAVAPIEVVAMLNDLYMRFDYHTTIHDVYKVETIGDAYMVVGGVPEASTVHAQSVANMSLDMVLAAREVKSPATGKPLQIRVGLHSGSVVAGVVGKKMPRYCMFGDTVNTASRMESHGLPGKIHVSSFTHEHLKDSEYIFDVRGHVEIKGKGQMVTYFLTANSEKTLAEPEDPTLPSEAPVQQEVAQTKLPVPDPNGRLPPDAESSFCLLL